MQKVMMTMLAGTQPDIIALDASSAAIFINNNALVDLTPFIEWEQPGATIVCAAQPEPCVSRSDRRSHRLDQVEHGARHHCRWHDWAA